MSATTERKQVAVIGSGIAGLSCAYLLSQGGHDVTLFERESRPGMDAYGVDLEDGRRVDAPPRAFSEGFYPNLMAMYRAAGVEYVRWSWAFAACIYQHEEAYFRVGGKVSFLGFRLPALRGSFWRLLLPKNIRMMYDGYRFYKDVRRDFVAGNHLQTPFGEYLKQGNYSEQFVRIILLPMLSMICTACYETVLAYPTGVLMEYWNTNSTHNQFRTVHGSYDAAAKLTQHVKRVQLNTIVSSVHGRGADDGGGGKLEKPRVEFREVIKDPRAKTGGNPQKVAKENGKQKGDKDASVETMWGVVDETCLGPPTKLDFDEVVLATPANVAARILADGGEGTVTTKLHLRGFAYEPSIVVIHRDRQLMPVLEKDWAAMNMVINKAQSAVMFSMWASHESVLDIDETDRGPLFQTWNPFVEVAPGCLLKKIRFERSVMTPDTLTHIQGLARQQGKGGVWCCGAYALNSIPLQENGVRSALNVAQCLGVDCPWAQEDRRKQYKVTSDVKELPVTTLTRAAHVVVAAAAFYGAWVLRRRAQSLAAVVQ